MKATIDIPDDLYRSVKARSAMEGRPLRAVAVDLFQQWLASSPEEAATEPEPLTSEELAKYPWLAISRRYIRPGMSHDLGEMKAAAAQAWGEEVARKLKLSTPQS